LINHLGQGRFVGYSAGSHPKGAVHPMALRILEETNQATADLRSKSWDEFAHPGSPALDIVITVCDNAAGETCPVWFGAPLIAHWGLDDPAEVIDSTADQRQAFLNAYRELLCKVTALVNLPIHILSREALAKELQALASLGKSGEFC
jgi:arsenate reductase (thioredoxin)